MTRHKRPALTIVPKVEAPNANNERDEGFSNKSGNGGGFFNWPQKEFARRINECVKHFNSFANTLGATIIGAAVIIPFVKDRAASIDADGMQWCAIGLLFHILAYVVVFSVMESEE